MRKEAGEDKFPIVFRLGSLGKEALQFFLEFGSQKMELRVDKEGNISLRAGNVDAEYGDVQLKFGTASLRGDAVDADVGSLKWRGKGGEVNLSSFLLLAGSAEIRSGNIQLGGAGGGPAVRGDVLLQALGIPLEVYVVDPSFTPPKVLTGVAKLTGPALALLTQSLSKTTKVL